MANTTDRAPGAMLSSTRHGEVVWSLKEIVPMAFTSTKPLLEPIGTPAGDLKPGLSPNAPPYVPFPLALRRVPAKPLQCCPCSTPQTSHLVDLRGGDGWDGATTRDPSHLFLPDSSLGSSVGPFWTGLGSSPHSCSPVLARVSQRIVISSMLIILVTDLHPEPPGVHDGLLKLRVRLSSGQGS